MPEKCAPSSRPHTLEHPRSRSPAVVSTEPANSIPPRAAASKMGGGICWTPWIGMGAGPGGGIMGGGAEGLWGNGAGAEGPDGEACDRASVDPSSNELTKPKAKNRRI